MQLVYLYVDHFQVWKHQAFSVSPYFSVNFSLHTEAAAYSLVDPDRMIREDISIIENNCEQNDLFGPQISDMQLIVGRNGAGKSTLLNLLSLDQSEQGSWFALYISKETEYRARAPYTIVLEYSLGEGINYKFYHAEKNKENNTLKAIPCADEIGQNSEISCRYLIYKQLHKAEWYEDSGSSADGCGFSLPSIPRKRIDSKSIRQVFDYAWRAVKRTEPFAEKDMIYFSLQNVVLNIQLKKNELLQSADSNKGNEGQFQFTNSKKGNEGQFQFTNSKKGNEGQFQFTGSNKGIQEQFFHNLCGKILESWVDENEKHEIPIYVRKSFLRQAQRYSGKSSDSDYTVLIKQLFECADAEQEKSSLSDTQSRILDLPESFFADDTTIRIQIKDCTKEQKNRICELLDLMKFWKVSVSSISNLSNGEIQLLNLFASIHQSIADRNLFPSGTNCILLLDEPDYGFHPEWSRNLIYYFRKYLNNEPFKTYGCTYQLFITTHSPIMLSDIPPENITYITRPEASLEKSPEPKAKEAGLPEPEAKEAGLSETESEKAGLPELECRNERIVEKSGYGFMSNINDLMKQTFFVDSLYGENARRYANALIKEIVDIQEEVIKRRESGKKGKQPAENSCKEEERQLLDRIEQIEKRTKMIGEEVIRNLMLQRLKVIRRHLKTDLTEDKEQEIKRLKQRLAELESK